jgi:AcrR family transcriptional regulator
MPKLWSASIKAHRQDVKDAILDAVAALAAEHGLHEMTMSRIAEATGIGRATLYKYFSDIEAILFAWHERQVAAHLSRLTEVWRQAGSACEGLEAVLLTYASFTQAHDGSELAARLHLGAHVMRARRQLVAFITQMLAAAAQAGHVRSDVPTSELATYCLHALGAASTVSTKAAIRRLVKVILAGLRP